MFNILWITLSHLVYLNYQLPSSESLTSLLAQERQAIYRFINLLFVITFYYYYILNCEMVQTDPPSPDATLLVVVEIIIMC